MELNDVAYQITTTEMKKIFHDALNDMFKSSNREPKSNDLGDKSQEKLLLGNFTVDPTYTDFVGESCFETICLDYFISTTLVSYKLILNILTPENFASPKIKPLCKVKTLNWIVFCIVIPVDAVTLLKLWCYTTRI